MVVNVRLLMVLVASEVSAKVLCFLFVQIVEPHKSTAMVVVIISAVVVIISAAVISLCVLAVVKRGKPIAKKPWSSCNSNNRKEKNSNKDV